MVEPSERNGISQGAAAAVALSVLFLVALVVYLLVSGVGSNVLDNVTP